MKTMESLFLDELADIYDAETRLVRALPKMVKAARHGELREAFQSHLDETEQQVEKLSAVFEAFDRTPHGRKCAAMVGLIKEAEELMSDNKGSPTLDAALILAAQKVEHYEMATYGALRDWASQLGNQAAADVLQEILDEEKAADETLTDLARSCCNPEAQEAASETKSARSTRPSGHGQSRSGRTRVQSP